MQHAADPWTIPEVNGTHMGVAVTWWSAVVGRDAATLDTIRTTVPAAEAFRSALEVVIGLAHWLSANGDEHPDGGARLLRVLSADAAMLPASQRSVAREVGDQLADDPHRETFMLTPSSVETLMGLALLLARLIESRFGIAIEDQIATYRVEVLTLTLATGP